LLFLGGRGAGGKANQGGLLALTVIGNVQYKPDRTIMMGGKQICFSWAVVGREEKQIRVGCRH